MEGDAPQEQGSTSANPKPCAKSFTPLQNYFLNHRQLSNSINEVSHELGELDLLPAELLERIFGYAESNK